MPIQMDTSKTGLEMFFKPYQVHALSHLQATYPRGANTREVYTAVNHKTIISRTSIINFLLMATDEGILTHTETTGKGGYHYVYKLAHPGERLTTYLIEEMIRFLLLEFPVDARKVMPDMMAMMKRLGR